MRVTDLEIPFEEKLAKRLDKFAEMATRKKNVQDVFFCVHGRTGTGKTNTSLMCAYYLKWRLQHEYNHHRDINLFFTTGKALDFAKDTKEQIIIVDEPSLDAMSKDQMTKLSKDFIRLVNTMRQKRHIVIFNITRFWRFSFDLVFDRALAMIHMREGDNHGRFLYIRQKRLWTLWDVWQKKRKQIYGQVKSFGGVIAERTETLDENKQPYFNRLGITINGKSNCTYADYHLFKDESISQIGEGPSKADLVKENNAKKKVDLLTMKIVKGIEAFRKKYPDEPVEKMYMAFDLPGSTYNLYKKKLEQGVFA